MAAALSQLGWIIFPQQMLEKINNGQVLNASETVIFSKHPYTPASFWKKYRVLNWSVGDCRAESFNR